MSCVAHRILDSFETLSEFLRLARGSEMLSPGLNPQGGRLPLSPKICIRSCRVRASDIEVVTGSGSALSEREPQARSLILRSAILVRVMHVEPVPEGSDGRAADSNPKRCGVSSVKRVANPLAITSHHNM